MAAVDLVIVGDNNVLCTGASVTLQCTLTGNVLTWNTPDGALNFVRGRQVESNAGSYYGQLMEPDATHLRSTLSFIFTAEITINCSDTTASNSATLVVEGIASQVLDVCTLVLTTYRSTKCPGSTTDGPGKDHETQQDILLSVCGVEHS